jgi:hypothetical protein
MGLPDNSIATYTHVAGQRQRNKQLINSHNNTILNNGSGYLIEETIKHVPTELLHAAFSAKSERWSRDATTGLLGEAFSTRSVLRCYKLVRVSE